MNKSIKDDLHNFTLLRELRGGILQSKSQSSDTINFQKIYRDVAAQRRRRKIRLLLLTTVVSSAAAILIFVLIQKLAYHREIEQEYYNMQTEWIAISDEAILTSEYIKMYKNQKEINEFDLIWHTLD